MYANSIKVLTVTDQAILVQIKVFTTLSIGVRDPFSKTEVAALDNFRQILRCKRSFHGAPRYDWVGVYDLEDEEFESRNGLDKFLIGQLQLLFAIYQDNRQYNLAYIEWYDIGDKDHETGMWIVTRSGNYNVVSVEAIVRGIHLQPLFDSNDVARRTLLKHNNEYSFKQYLVNKYVDRASWEELY